MYTEEKITNNYCNFSERLCNTNLSTTFNNIGENTAFCYTARTEQGVRVDYVALNETGGCIFLEAKTRDARVDSYNTAILEEGKWDFLYDLQKETNSQVFYVVFVGNGANTYIFDFSRIPQSAWTYLPKWKTTNPIKSGGKWIVEPAYEIPWTYATHITPDEITPPSGNTEKITATPFESLKDYIIKGRNPQPLNELEFEKIRYKKK